MIKAFSRGGVFGMEDRFLGASKLGLYTSSAVGFFGAFTLTQWATLLGICGTIVGIVCTIFLTVVRNRREREEHDARMLSFRLHPRTADRRKKRDE
jgi:hypothetical protein